MHSLLRTIRAAFAGLPREAWWLALANAVNRSGSMVLPFLALYLVEARGLAPDAAGRMQSLYGVAAIGGSWLGGMLSDRVGSKRVQIGSLTTSALMFLILGELTSPVAIGCGLVALGICNESLRPANLTAMSLIGDESVRPRVIALNRLAINFGITFGWLVGGQLADQSFRLLFVFDAVTALAAACVVSRVVIPHVPRPPGSRPPLLPLRPLRDPVFAAFFALLFVLAVVLFQMESTYPIYMTSEYGLDKPAVASLFVINTLMIVALEMLLVKRFETKEPLRLVALGAFLLCISFGVLPLGSSYGVAAISMIVLTFGEMLWSPFTGAFVASRSRPSERGQYMGCYLLAFALAYAVAPALGTAAYTYLDRDAPWWIAFALGPLLAWGFLAVAKKSRTAAKREQSEVNELS
jgi:predicted MFS family arabinose efflux permease